MGLVGLVWALLTGMALASRAQPACTDHGQLVDGKCVCSAPLPVDAVAGWVGEKCSVQVHRLFLDGQDVQETCPGGHICNMVTPMEPVCFSTSIADLGSEAFHLNLLLTSNSVDAAVSLRGLLTNFTTVTDPTTGAVTVVPQTYPNEAAVFSFAMHTSHDGTAQLKLSRRQLEYGAFTGMYLCARSNANTTIGLRAAEHTCPFALQSNGSLQLCSGRGTTDTCPHGICTCPEPYAPPANWVMTSGLGFEDCSATLELLQRHANATVAPGSWSFYQVNLPAEGGHDLQLAAAATEATQGALVLYLRQLALPGAAEGQHELASDPSSWTRDLTAHVALRRKVASFRPGIWYLGVYNNGAGPVPYTITANLYDCPNNCSGRGTCAAETATCTCSGSAMAAPDCSISSYDLLIGTPLSTEQRAFTYDRLVLHGAKEQLHGSETSRLTITASFTTSDTDPQGLPPWINVRPMVLVSPSPDAAMNATAPGRGPQWFDAVARMGLAAPGSQYSMDVGPWMIADDGSLHVLFWNPLSGPARKVGYTLTVAVKAACPAGCSGHGTCDVATGLCTCEAPYLGSDCSVDRSKLSCTPGSSKPVHRDGLCGTCWVHCAADGSGYDDTGCDELQCDGPTLEHGQLRRKGGEVECVEDTCAPGGSAVVLDPSGDFLCSKRCACPEDGGACALEDSCQPDSLQCLKELRLAADKQTCAAAGCEEGALRRTPYDLDGGSAFSLCTCATPGDPASCAFSAPTQGADNAGGVVSCLPGYERQGPTSSIRLSDGGEVITGGKCGRLRRRGTSGGMVFFYCLLSIALAAGLLVGGKYGLLWYEQYRYGKSVFSHGYVSWPLFGNRANAGAGADDW